MLNNIPTTWLQKYLSDSSVAQVIMGQSPDSSSYNEEKEKLGEVVDILETGANLVLRVKSRGNSFLLPFVPAFIVDVNKEAHEITIREMEGLR